MPDLGQGISHCSVSRPASRVEPGELAPTQKGFPAYDLPGASILRGGGWNPIAAVWGKKQEAYQRKLKWFLFSTGYRLCKQFVLV
jgi:hypothetical protein